MSLYVDDVLMRPIFFLVVELRILCERQNQKGLPRAVKVGDQWPVHVKLRRNDYKDNQLRMFTVVAILSHAGISVLASICVIASFLVLRNFFTYS